MVQFRRPIRRVQNRPLVETVQTLRPAPITKPLSFRTIGVARLSQSRRGSVVLGRAALLSGTLCRLQGYQKDGKLRALQDCVLFLQALKLGLAILTANVNDFDILL
jgi:hypothetical protein